MMFSSKFIDGSFLLFMVKCVNDGRKMPKPEKMVECLGHFMSCWCSLQSNGLDTNGNVNAGFLTEVRIEFAGKENEHQIIARMLTFWAYMLHHVYLGFWQKIMHNIYK